MDVIDFLQKRFRGNSDIAPETKNFIDSALENQTTLFQTAPSIVKDDATLAFDNHAKLVLMRNIREEALPLLRERLTTLNITHFQNINAVAVAPCAFRNTRGYTIDELESLLDPEPDLIIYDMQNFPSQYIFRFRKKIYGNVQVMRQREFEGLMWTNQSEDESYYVSDLKLIINLLPNYNDIEVWIDYPTQNEKDLHGTPIRIHANSINIITDEIIEWFWHEVLAQDNASLINIDLSAAIETLRDTRNNSDGILAFAVFNHDEDGKQYKMTRTRVDASLDQDIYVGQMFQDVNLTTEVVQFIWEDHGRNIVTLIFNTGYIIVGGRYHQGRDVNYAITRIRALNQQRIPSTAGYHNL